MPEHQQSLKEEVANTITHGLGVLFCIVAIPFIIASALANGSATTLWAVAIFCFGMGMVYLSSTLFHAIQHKPAKRLLQIWDHISIFMLIAGTYTPMVLKYTQRDTAFIFLSAMWAIVAVGSFIKIFFTGKYEIVSVSLYVVMGWMAVFISRPLMANMPAQIFWCLVAGGLAYTLGIVFFLWKRLMYSHAIWHIFVLTGTVTHFFAVYNSITINIKLSASLWQIYC